MAPGRPNRLRLPAGLLLLPCLALGLQPCFVRERFRSQAPKRQAPRSGNDDARMLTGKIKKADTGAELLGVLDAAVDTSPSAFGS